MKQKKYKDKAGEKSKVKYSRVFLFLLLAFSLAAIVFQAGQINALQRSICPADRSLPSPEEFCDYRSERLYFCLGLIAALICCGVLVIRLVKKPLISKITLLMVAVCVTLISLESVFMYIPVSAADGYQLSDIVWKVKYWNGYIPDYDQREHPMVLRSLGHENQQKDEELILVVGDSFGAGDGIADESKVFSSLLQEQLKMMGISGVRCLNICERVRGATVS